MTADYNPDTDPDLLVDGRFSGETPSLAENDPEVQRFFAVVRQADDDNFPRTHAECVQMLQRLEHERQAATLGPRRPDESPEQFRARATVTRKMNIRLHRLRHRALALQQGLPQTATDGSDMARIKQASQNRIEADAVRLQELAATNPAVAELLQNHPTP